MIDLNPCTIIAEAGINHCGNFELALKMVEMAAESGADYVKFQTFVATELATINAHVSEYQKDGVSSLNMLEMLRRYELPLSSFNTIASAAQSRQIGFLTTAFDLPSLEVVLAYDLDFLKIGSGQITDLPFLKAVSTGRLKQVLMSTGMSTLAEVEKRCRFYF